MTPICPTCGCSLVRLDIKREDAARHAHEGDEYLFHLCRCRSCATGFAERSGKLLERLEE